jgi:hypothetical protein
MPRRFNSDAVERFFAMKTSPNELAVENDVVVPLAEVPSQADTPSANDEGSTLSQVTPIDTDYREPGNDESDPEAPWGRKADGTPKGKPGRPRKDETQRERLDSVKQAPPRKPKPTPTASTPPIVMDYEGAAVTAANAFFGVGQVIFGNDWEPDVTAGEHLLVKKSFRDYFESEQIGKIPPAMALMLTLGAYGAVRVTKPSVQSRLQKFVAWVKGFKKS